MKLLSFYSKYNDTILYDELDLVKAKFIATGYSTFNDFNNNIKGEWSFRIHHDHPQHASSIQNKNTNRHNSKETDSFPWVLAITTESLGN